MKVKRPCPRRTAYEELLWLDIPALATPLTPVTTGEVHQITITIAETRICCELGVQRFCTIYAYVAGYLPVRLAVAYYKTLATPDARSAVESKLKVVNAGSGPRIMNYVT